MRVLLYMAVSADGFIAREDDSTDWSDAEWDLYVEKVEEVGNIIIGSRTFAIMEENDEFSRLGNPEIVVLGKDGIGSPRAALGFLEKKGFSTALVAGGCLTNTSFAEESLIDEVYLDVESVVFGKGIPLSNKEIKMELLDVRIISPSLKQQHYRVVN